MNELFSGNSVILTNVHELFYTLQLFKDIRHFDIAFISVNNDTKYILTNENLILLKRISKESNWTLMFYFDKVIDSKIKKNIDIIFGDVKLVHICPLKKGFLAVYSDSILRNDSIFNNVKNIYQIDEILSFVYENIIDMLVIDFNDGYDFNKVNFLQKKLVYITKDEDVFSRNFRYKNIKKLSMKGETE